MCVWGALWRAAFVMTMLFRSGSIKEKVDSIAYLTYTHTKNLGLFALSYNSLIAAGRLAYRALGLGVHTTTGLPAAHWHPLVAGGIAGWFIWGKYSGVNFQVCVLGCAPARRRCRVLRVTDAMVARRQIVLYLLSRIMIGWCKTLAAKGVPPFCMTTFSKAYPFLAAVVWANVMWLFENHRANLHSSLSKSMDFLYHDSNKWATLSDFLPSPATVAVLLYYYFYATVKKKASSIAKK